MATKTKSKSKAKRKVVAQSVLWQSGQDVVRVRNRRLELRNLLKMTRSDFQRLVNVSERTIAKVEESAEPAKKLQRAYVEVLRLCGALAEVVDADALGAWFKMPNQNLGGRTPMEVIEHGQIDRLWEIVYRLRSGNAGLNRGILVRRVRSTSDARAKNKPTDIGSRQEQAPDDHTAWSRILSAGLLTYTFRQVVLQRAAVFRAFRRISSISTSTCIFDFCS